MARQRWSLYLSVLLIAALMKATGTAQSVPGRTLIRTGHPTGLQSGTLNAADLLDCTARAASLEAAKWADVIAVEDDPLQDIRTVQHVRFVMDSGAVDKNESDPVNVETLNRLLRSARPQDVPTL